MTIVWSQTAINDLTHLRRYIAETDPPAARKIADAILESIDNLQQFPDIGRPGRLPETRELVIPGTPFVVPYTVTAGGIEIIAVLHGAQRWPPE